jgi:predicted Zn-dependent peptidase
MNPLQRAALAALLIIPSMSNAQIDRSKPPAPGPAPDVRVGRAHTTTLENGLKVIVVENTKLPAVSVQFRFDHAPVMQGDLAGYQDIFGDVLIAGTARRSKRQVDDMVDKLGAQLSASAEGVYASVLKRNLGDLMFLLYEVVTAPAFPLTEFEKVKTRALSALKSREDDPDQIADVVGRALTYGKGHPYGEVPTEGTLGKVGRDHLVAFYKRYFRPENGYLVFVGDIGEPEAVELARRYFGEWRAEDAVPEKDAQGRETVKDLGVLQYPTFVPQANLPRRVCFVDRPGSAQSVIKVLHPVDLKPGDPLAMPAQVLNTILGGGVFNARLMQNLRERHGFTYGAYSSVEADRYCGQFSGGCSVRNAVTDSAVTEMLTEIEMIREAPVRPDELALAKSYMAGSFARSLEDPRTVARFALNTALYGLPDDHYATYLKRLDTVTADGVMAAARQLLKPDNITVLVVGDKAEVAGKLAPISFGRTVEYLDINGDTYREKAALPPPGVKAADVLRAHVKAIGGIERIAAIKRITRTYEARVEDKVFTWTEHNATPVKHAVRLAVGSMVLEESVFDGVRGRRRTSEGPKDLLEDQLAVAREEAYIVPELFYAELDLDALLTGVVEIDGRECYRLFVKRVDGSNFTDYYDRETGLKRRRVEMQAGEDGNFQVTTNWKDYKSVDGVLFPHTIDQHAGMDLHFTATSILVNKDLPPGVFSMP